MTLGQRIAVLGEGTLAQCASPATLYERPASTFVARFIGSPPMNLLDGAQAAAAPAAVRERVTRAGLTLGIRPHDIAIVPPESGALTGVIDIVEPLGHASIVHVTVERAGERARMVVVVTGASTPHARGTVGLETHGGPLHLFAPDGRAWRRDGDRPFAARAISWSTVW